MNKLQITQFEELEDWAVQVTAPLHIQLNILKQFLILITAFCLLKFMTENQNRMILLCNVYQKHKCSGAPI
jgi:hypothetical protein